MRTLLTLGLCVLLVAGVLSFVRGLNRPDTPPQTPGPGYRNEGYTAPPPDKSPPPQPEPTTMQQAEDWLLNNQLYRQDVVVPTRCETSEPDLETASRAELQRHMNEVVACLMRVWIGPVEAAGFTLPRPSVTVYDTQVTSGCGKLPRGNAVYCGLDQQIYYSSELPQALGEIGTRRWTVEAIVAHEFGHAVQSRTGIQFSTIAMRLDEPSKAAGNVWARRQEMQADCFAGTFLHSVAESKAMTPGDLDTLKRLFYELGDDVLSGRPDVDEGHGKGENRRRWAETGLAATNLGSCNTFSRPAEETR